MNLSLWLTLRLTYHSLCMGEYFFMVHESEEIGIENAKDLNTHMWQVRIVNARSLSISSWRIWPF